MEINPQTMMGFSEEEREQILKGWLPKVGETVWICDDFHQYSGEFTVTEILGNGDLKVEGDPAISSVNMQYYKNRVFPLNLM